MTDSLITLAASAGALVMVGVLLALGLPVVRGLLRRGLYIGLALLGLAVLALVVLAVLVIVQGVG